MEKQQRKQQATKAKWEAKKAKEEEKLEQERRRTSYLQTMKRIDQIVREWEPSPNEVFAKARSLVLTPSFRPQWYRFADDDRVISFMHNYRPMFAKRIHLFSSITSLEAAAEIAEEKSWKLESRALQLVSTIARHQSRLDTLRKELLVKTTRLRVIQNCLLIKEELMTNVWHPRRVSHILETYGWEVYENLLGVE